MKFCQRLLKVLLHLLCLDQLKASFFMHIYILCWNSMANLLLPVLLIALNPIEQNLTKTSMIG